MGRKPTVSTCFTICGKLSLYVALDRIVLEKPVSHENGKLQL